MTIRNEKHVAHTPGPWKVDGRAGIYQHDIVGPNGEDIGYANPSDGADESTEYPVDANARLMAAAPDLLDVLKQIASYEGDGDKDGMFLPKPPYSWETVARIAVDLARAAIAKADGTKGDASA